MPALREHIAAASERYAKGFKFRGLALPPSNHFIFVTCMDARIDTSQAFGIGVGEAHVIRNVSAPGCLLTDIVEERGYPLGRASLMRGFLDKLL